MIRITVAAAIDTEATISKMSLLDASPPADGSTVVVIFNNKSIYHFRGTWSSAPTGHDDKKYWSFSICPN